jgi:hypothetical protein
MKKCIIACSIVLLLFSCSLSATQETNFNTQSAAYLKAVNSGFMLKVVSKTHPSYVKYIKSKGDQIFQKTFSKNNLGKDRITHIEIRQIKQKEQRIQIAFISETKDAFKQTIERKPYVAISENNGLDWFFVPYKIWKNKSILLNVNKLL